MSENGKPNGEKKEEILKLYESGKKKIHQIESKQEKFLKLISEINKEREILKAKQSTFSRISKILLLLFVVGIGIIIMYLPEKNIVGKNIFDFGPPPDLYIDMEKFTVINFFASWCDPCREEAPELVKFYQNSSSATVVGVAVDDSKDNVQKFIREYGINFPVIFDNHTFSKKLGISGLPTTIIVSPDYKIKKVIFGPVTQQTLERFISNLKK
ncbi:Thiol-disulfide oxidoreductase ResA [bacterium HR19]|nr:Thiol-disulfide oxidoreductase ResA [bacterium HR19]